MTRLKNLKTAFIAIGAVTLFFSCKKEESNIFNMFTGVTLTLHDSGPYCVTGYKQVSESDSIYIDYTIASADKDMYAVCLLQTGTASPKKTFTNEQQRRSYSEVIKMSAADLKAGKTSYRIYGLDKDGVYVGDGYKTITIDVIPGYTFMTERNVYTPDSASKATKCYFSLSSGEAFTYADAAPKSAAIDFGVYSTFVVTGGKPGRVYWIYSLSASTLPFNIFDVSSWTKRTTLFSNPISGAASKFRDLNTGAKLVTEAKKVNINLKTPTTSLTTGSMVYYLTPEGKYGAFLVNSIYENRDLNGNLSNGAFILNLQIKNQN